jgi:hypothetical protein
MHRKLLFSTLDDKPVDGVAADNSAHFTSIFLQGGHVLFRLRGLDPGLAG